MKVIVFLILNALLTYVPVLLGIAFVILSERKILAAIQRRSGPRVVGFEGILQSFVDGFKLVLKENIIPFKSNKFIFFFAAFLMFVVSLFHWALIPVNLFFPILEVKHTVFLSFILSIINAYCVILAG